MKLNYTKATPNEVAKVLVWEFGKMATGNCDWKAEDIYVNGHNEEDGVINITGSDKEFIELEERIQRHSDRIKDYFGITKIEERG